MSKQKNDQQGFTLIELVVAMAVTFVVAAAIFAAYRAQQMAHHNQRELVGLHQNLRSAIYFITRDLRMAGYDPQWNAGATILIADEGTFRFQADLDGDGTIQNNEVIEYGLTNDADSDGVADGLPCHLGRNVGLPPNNTGRQIIAENVQAIDFEYMTYTPNAPFLPASMNVALGGRDGVPVGPPANLQDDIRFIRLTLVASSNPRQAAMSFKRTDNRQYWNALRDRMALDGQNDSLRRAMLVTEIQLRNM
jgi:prepilin-type N-terminal cleavage/methylation domain-containing protein